MDRRHRLLTSRLYLCADAVALRRVLDGALAGGTDVVQLRDKRAPDAVLLDTGRWAQARCAAAGALFVVNDRPDLAAAVGADGVHVGQDDATVEEARAAVGADRIVGLSTHSVDEARDGARGGADYLGLGPVAATPTKRGRPGIGLEPVRWAAAHLELPFFVTGGMAPDTVGTVVEAGARRVVVVRAITRAADPEGAARAIRAALGH